MPQCVLLIDQERKALLYPGGRKEVVNHYNEDTPFHQLGVIFLRADDIIVHG